MVITHTLKTGDHIVCVDDVYGGTGRFFRRLAVEVYGMQVDFVDMTDLKNLRNAFKKNTKVRLSNFSLFGLSPQQTQP